MDAEREDTQCLTVFWRAWNKVLADFTADPTYVFNPIRFILDEHHANFNSIKAVFGEAAVTRLKTCEFHYKQCVQRHQKTLPSKFRDEFESLALKVLEAQSQLECEVAASNMMSFCEDHTQPV